MKTVIRRAGNYPQRATPKSLNDDDLWEGDLPLVPGRLPEFKVSITELSDDLPPKIFTVSQVCLEVCGDWSQQVIYVSC